MKLRLLIIVGASYLLVLLLIVVIGRSLIYKNVSISEPLGYYLLLPEVAIRKDDLVLMCVKDSYKHVFNELGLGGDKSPDESPNSSRNVAGQCSNGLPYLLKRVVATRGDRVEVAKSGIKINGILYPNSQQFNEGRGVKLHPLNLGYSHILTENEYFMLGNSPHSVDSRYFGIVKASDIKGRVILIHETAGKLVAKDGK